MEDRTTVQQLLRDRRHHCTGNLVRVNESATKEILRKLQQQSKYNKRSIVKAIGACIVCKREKSVDTIVLNTIITFVLINNGL